MTSNPVFLCTTAVNRLFKALVVMNERKASGERLGGNLEHLSRVFYSWLITSYFSAVKDCEYYQQIYRFSYNFKALKIFS